MWRLSSYISQGVYTVSGPFHPFGGAVDIIVVQQQDGSFKCSPWYVRFGKFQGVLKREKTKTVTVAVNGVDASFRMCMDFKGEVFFQEDAPDGDDATAEVSDFKEETSDEDDEDQQQPQNDDQLRPLVASSTLMSIQRVAESDSGPGVQVYESATLDEPAVVPTSDGELTTVSPVEVTTTEVIEDRCLVRAEGGSDDMQSEIRKLEEQVRVPESSTSKEVPSSSRPASIDQEMAWKGVVIKSATFLKEAPIKQNPGKVDGTEKKPWGLWGWVGKQQASEATTKSSEATTKVSEAPTTTTTKQSEVTTTTKPSDATTKGGNKVAFKGGNKVTTSVAPAAAEQVDTATIVEDARDKPLEDDDHDVVEKNKPQLKPGRSILGMMFGGKERQQSQSPLGSPPSVVKLLEQKWSNGTGRDAEENWPNGTESDTVKWEPAECLSCNGDGNHSLDRKELSDAEVVLISGDGHLVVAKQDENSPRWSIEDVDHVAVTLELSNGDGDGNGVNCKLEVHSSSSLQQAEDVFKSCLALQDLVSETSDDDETNAVVGKQESEASSGPEDSPEAAGLGAELDFELSLCRQLLREGMGTSAAAAVFDANKVSYSKLKSSGCLGKDDSLVVRVGGEYYSAAAAATILFGLLAFGKVVIPSNEEAIRVEAPPEQVLDIVPKTLASDVSASGWKFWPFAMGRKKAAVALRVATQGNGYYRRVGPGRTYIPTSAQLASLNLKPGRNVITFTFTTRLFGKQQVDARIYLWKWDAKVVLSDVDGTITKSDLLGQVMPLVGRDWSQIGVTRLFSAIKDNGYELMFLSARAIAQAYLTRQFLENLKQDGEQLPDGPVVLSPDGLFPSIYREVIRRTPHEFKIACLEDIKALFPPESQPFYAGFGNRETDAISYLKVGIPKGKVFTINPKGEVIVNNFLDLKSYTSLHKLVNDMFPPVHMTEREDFNSWNFWRVPLPPVDDL